MNLSNTEYTSVVISTLENKAEKIVNRKHKIFSDNEKLNGKVFKSTTVIKKGTFSPNTIYFLDGSKRKFSHPLSVFKYLNKTS